jgi:N-acetyl-alpha-D-muramate 1-phosphate uridylyltransferase
VSTAGLCAVLLAAGAGTRLRPLTALRPKALCPVGNVTLLDRALEHVRRLGFDDPGDVAVNAHHHAGQVVEAVGARAHVSVEPDVALGTAGALGALRMWIGGRDVLVCNADAYLDPGSATADLIAGWSGERPRLLVVDDPARGDFGRWRFAGMSLLPAAVAATLQPTPTGLYEVVWRDAHRRGALELTPFAGTFVDCGTPADYLAANLHTARGSALVAPDAVVTGTVHDSVVGSGAVVAGRIARTVVWPRGRVRPDEDLVEVVRAGSDVTVPAGRAAFRGRS